MWVCPCCRRVIYHPPPCFKHAKPLEKPMAPWSKMHFLAMGLAAAMLAYSIYMSIKSS
jgi:hypothetical protein